VQQRHPVLLHLRGCSGVPRGCSLTAGERNPPTTADRLINNASGSEDSFEMSCLLCVGDSGRLNDDKVWHCLGVELHSAGGTGSAGYDGEENLLNFLL